MFDPARLRMDAEWARGEQRKWFIDGNEVSPLLKARGDYMETAGRYARLATAAEELVRIREGAKWSRDWPTQPGRWYWFWGWLFRSHREEGIGPMMIPVTTYQEDGVGPILCACGTHTMTEDNAVGLWLLIETPPVTEAMVALLADAQPTRPGQLPEARTPREEVLA